MSRKPTTATRNSRGFSLLELLVTLAVVATLSSMMFPAFSKVHDMARRLMCQNNMRSLFVALENFSSDQRQEVRLMYPSSVYVNAATDRTNPLPTCRPQQFMALTTDTPVKRNGVERLEWDGLGKLWAGAGRYVADATTFYCPAHRSNHTIAQYADAFKSRATTAATSGPVYGNYHYWAAWNRAAEGRQSAQLGPSVGAIRDVILTDGLRTSLDLNHRAGCNALKTDGSIDWIGGTPYYQATLQLKATQAELPVAQQAAIFGNLVSEFNRGSR